MPDANQVANRSETTDLRLAIVQMSCSDVLEDNLAKAEAFVREAAGEGANVILLQELFENLYFPQLEREDAVQLI